MCSAICACTVSSSCSLSMEVRLCSLRLEVVFDEDQEGCIRSSGGGRGGGRVGCSGIAHVCCSAVR